MTSDQQRTCYEGLTTRQREVALLSASGLVMKEVAHKLGISVRTAEVYKAQLYDALEVRSGVELVHFLYKIGEFKV